MSDALQTEPETGNDSAIGEYVENASRTDGSRTPIWKIARCHQMKREGRTVNAISEILGMDARTINAVLARQDTLISDARMLLSANALGFVGDAIEASRKAAEKGRIEGISAMLDRLGVTEPPTKGQQGSQVAVQINLHGGPEPLSLAKVSVTSETPENQAEILEGLITPIQSTVATSPQVERTQVLAGETDQAKVTHAGAPVQPATNVAVLRKQAE